MVSIRQSLYGEHPRIAVVLVLAVAITTAAVLIPFGALEIDISGLLGQLAFVVVFGVLPWLAGGICGWYRLGLPTAAASGLAPGISFYLVVAVGTALDVGSFGGGDSPLSPFTLVLTAPSLASAMMGFILTTVAATAKRP